MEDIKENKIEKQESLDKIKKTYPELKELGTGDHKFLVSSNFRSTIEKEGELLKKKHSYIVIGEKPSTEDCEYMKLSFNEIGTPDGDKITNDEAHIAFKKVDAKNCFLQFNKDSITLSFPGINTPIIKTTMYKNGGLNPETFMTAEKDAHIKLEPSNQKEAENFMEEEKYSNFITLGEETRLKREFQLLKEPISNQKATSYLITLPNINSKEYLLVIDNDEIDKIKKINDLFKKENISAKEGTLTDSGKSLILNLTTISEEENPKLEKSIISGRKKNGVGLYPVTETNKHIAEEIIEKNKQ